MKINYAQIYSNTVRNLFTNYVNNVNRIRRILYYEGCIRIDKFLLNLIIACCF